MGLSQQDSAGFSIRYLSIRGFLEMKLISKLSQTDNYSSVLSRRYINERFLMPSSVTSIFSTTTETREERAKLCKDERAKGPKGQRVKRSKGQRVKRSRDQRANGLDPSL